MNESVSVRELARKARAAAAPLSAAPPSARNQALLSIAEEISAHIPQLLKVNQEDVAQAWEENLAAPLLSRLQLTEAKCRRMIEELQALAGLPDPLGTVSSALELSSSTSIFGFLTSARAIVSLCLCPPEKFLPSCSTWESSPRSNPFANSFAWASSNARYISSSVAFSAPQRMFSRRLPAKSTAFCGTTPNMSEISALV